MKGTLLPWVATAMICATPSQAQEPELPRQIVIERSTASAPLGEHATLTMGVLTRDGGKYVGTYTITISPLPLGSESGKLEIRVPPGAPSDKPLAFTGDAHNQAGKPRTIKGTAYPEGSQHGKVHVEIESEHGTLLFDTTYRPPSS